MQIDPRTVDLAESLEAEVCIVGAGIAGILLAHKLAAAGRDVILLEAGELAPGHATIKTFAAQPTPQSTGKQRHASRVERSGDVHPGTAAPPSEGFGGTSLTWGGQLLPLPAPAAFDPAAHTATNGVAGPNWPLAASELTPFLSQAERVLGVDDLPYEAREFFADGRGEMPPLFAGIPNTMLRVSKFAPFSHRNLAQTLGCELLDHPGVRIIHHARAVELLLDPDPGAQPRRLDAVLALLPAGKHLRVRAAEVVLAAGTLESVRLLLASRSSAAGGVGNAHGQLGRNVHDHLTVTAAVFTGAARARVLEQLGPSMVRGPGGITMHSLKLEAGPGLCRQVGSPAVMAHLTLDEPDGSAVGALRSVLRDRQRLGSAAALRKNVRHTAPAFLDAMRLTWAARVLRRRYVSPQATVALRLNCAQPLPTASHILLSEDRDDAGQPKAAFHWKISNAECLSLMAFASWVREHFGELALDPSVQWNGKLFPGPEAPLHVLADASAQEPIDALKADLDDARHLMGGALMGTDPRTSVVDPELRVHNVANLYVASLAVFPDGSAQLPTLTLMALVFRLADRLAKCRTR